MTAVQGRRGLLLLFSCLVALTLCTAIDSDHFTSAQFLRDPDSIVSNNGDFRLGFFSPSSNTTNRYVGIWYNRVPADNVVWVANRDNPLNDSSGGVLRISEDGSLQVLSGRNDTLWSSSSNASVSPPANNTNLSVQLLDSGNLVLLANDTNDNSTILWQSFDHLIDTIFPNSQLPITEQNMRGAIRPWASASDPSSHGRFSVGTDSFLHSQVVIWDGDRPHWRSGPWNGNIFLGLMYGDAATNYANTFVRENGPTSIDVVYTGARTLAFSHYKFGYDGTVSERWWDGNRWQFVWRAPEAQCDFYGYCGAFGTCNPTRSPMCRCLRGFVPRNMEEWRRGNWSSGCVRRAALQCGNPGSREDGFFTLSRVKVPDLPEWSVGVNQVDCRSQCLRNCSCVAYAYDAGAGCMYWSRDLIDIQEFPIDGVDLYLRLPHSELGDNSRQRVVIGVSVSISTVVVATTIYLLWRWMARRKGDKVKRKKQTLENLKYGDHKHQAELEELPLFEFRDLTAATNGFQESNKLGQGGFGPVYKCVSREN